MSTQITLSNGGIQDAEGNALALGTVVLQLSNDAVTNDASPNKLVSANVPIIINLDANGNVTGTPKIWSNSELTPSGTSYSVMAFTAAGAQAWRAAQNWVFTAPGGSTIDLGTMVPTSSSVSYSAPLVAAPGAIQTITGFPLQIATVLQLGSTSDTGLSRDSAGVIDVGNGTAGDKSGTINAANVNVGTALGVASLKLGSGTNTNTISTTTTAARTTTLPDANSNTVQPTTATGSNWVTNVDSSGVQHKTQPAFTDISGSVAAAQLPNPSASSLGGVQSITAASHNFLTSISTSGVPAQAQPAFTDISGTVAAAQLPAPSASTLGGVKSLTAASHQFLTSISTAGLPTQAQPAFADISGTATAAQLPTITRAISFVIDGGGSVPATGAYGQLDIPFAGTITGWVLTADQSGSAVVDVLRSTYSGFPTTASLASTDKPTLSSVQKNENLAVSVWTTSLSAGDQLQVNLNSVTSCTRLNLTVIVTTTVA